MLLRAGEFTFTFPRPILVMGILNVTPDSFSDGGRFESAKTAVGHAFRLIEEGADILDVGGESTRPGAAEVSADEECRRVLPVIEKLVGRIAVPISIDTRKPEVARAALEAGASIVNDIGANRTETSMWEAVAESGAGYVAMHMQGSPQNMQQKPAYDNVTREVTAFFSDRLARLQTHGVNPEQVVFDVGIGFGKTLEHNLQLLADLEEFISKKRPLLLGASRKSFMGKLLGLEVEKRLPASLACACWAVKAGIQMLRVHDVEPTVQTVRMFEAIQAHHG